MLDMQLEIDILNVLKKDPGVDQTALINREKAVIVDALKNKYSLPLLLDKLDLAKSCYYYQENVLSKPDKYAQLSKLIKEMFNENKGRYGNRRIYGLLDKESSTISEKVVRRIMKQENLVVRIQKNRKYSSYRGEISPAVSKSKKGCSPDNSAYAGLFGRLKNEMFYNQDWSCVSIEEFIDTLNTYLVWYNEKRIKKSLGI